MSRPRRRSMPPGSCHGSTVRRRSPRVRARPCARPVTTRCAFCAGSASSIRASLDDYSGHDGYRGLRAGDRARTRGRHRRDHGVKAHGPWRGGLSDRTQVGRRGGPDGDHQVRDLQRRRVGARDVQGPGAARGRPIRRHRGDDHRRVRDRRQPGLPLPSGRVPRGRGDRAGGPGRGSSARPARRRSSSWARTASPSTSSCGAAPAPTSAARRRRSSSRSRASAASRATSRRSRSRSACSANRPS